MTLWENIPNTLTVGELKEKLSDIPDDTPIFIKDPYTMRAAPISKILVLILPRKSGRRIIIE